MFGRGWMIQYCNLMQSINVKLVLMIYAYRALWCKLVSLSTTISLANVVDKVHDRCKLEFIIKVGYAIAFQRYTDMSF